MRPIYQCYSWILCMNLGDKEIDTDGGDQDMSSLLSWM